MAVQIVTTGKRLAAIGMCAFVRLRACVIPFMPIKMADDVKVFITIGATEALFSTCSALDTTPEPSHVEFSSDEQNVSYLGVAVFPGFSLLD